jgi:hypothetical protein
LDALHVASARLAFARARRRGVATGNLVTADTALLGAAIWAGLPTLNPEDRPRYGADPQAGEVDRIRAGWLLDQDSNLEPTG